MYKVNHKPLEEIYKQYSELKKSDVENILQWIRNQPHLPKITGNINLKINKDYNDNEEVFVL